MGFAYPYVLIRTTNFICDRFALVGDQDFELPISHQLHRLVHIRRCDHLTTRPSKNLRAGFQCIDIIVHDEDFPPVKNSVHIG